MNVAHMLEHAARLSPTKPALIFEGRSFTYRELNALSVGWARRLSALGIARGDRVAMFLPNIPALVGAYFGIQRIGAIAVCVNPAYKPDEAQFVLTDSDARAVVTTEALRGRVRADRCPRLRHVLIAEDGAARVAAGAAPSAAADPHDAPAPPAVRDTPREALLATPGADLTPAAAAVDCAPHDPAVILYTAATGGFPKGATLSHANVVSQARACAGTFRLSPGDTMLLFLPASYILGQTVVMLPCFEVGATLVLHREYVTAEILASVVEHHVTVFLGMPAVYTILANRASAEQMRSVRLYGSATCARLPPETARQWRSKFGMDIHVCHGMTEASLVSFNQRPDDKPGSVGTPIEDVEMRVVDEHGRPVETGHAGEIVVRGPHVMLGYWQRPAETGAAVRNGWFHTGDLGRADTDGYYYVEGHLVDLVSVGGHTVYAAEVERVLRGHPSVAEAAIHGGPDAVMGEQVRASIVLAPGAWATAEEMIAFCEERLADFKVPRGIEFLDSLPKDRNGAVLKHVLRERFPGGGPAADSPGHGAAATAEALRAWIVSWLSRTLALDPRAIDTQSPIAGHGVSSLMAVTLARDLQRRSGRPVSALATWSFPTIDALARHLADDTRAPDAPSPAPGPADATPEGQDPSALSDEALEQLLAAEIERARRTIR